MRIRTLLLSAGVVAFGAGFYVAAPAKEPKTGATVQSTDAREHVCEIEMLVFRGVVTPTGTELENVKVIPIVAPCHLAEQAVQGVFQTIDLGGPN